MESRENSGNWLKLRFVAVLLGAIIIAGIVVGLVLYYRFPTHWFWWYPLIPAYFTLLALFTSLEMNRYSQKHEPRKIITAFMMMRGIKIFLTLAAILLYYWLVDIMMTEVVLITFGFYLFHLFVETYLLYRFDKAAKKSRDPNA